MAEVKTLGKRDAEKLVKAAQCADLLVADLRDLNIAENPLLAEMGMELLQQAAVIKQRLDRLAVITKS